MAEEIKKDPVKARILQMRKRYRKAVDADRENRQNFTDDMKFIHEPGEQWDSIVKKERGDDRPMYQFNRLRTTIKRVVNSMRANPAAGKVRGTEDSDKDTAEVLEGLIRNIANVSDFDSIRDNAAEYQVCGGYAAWRITTDYSSDTAFEQDIKIEQLRNPLCLYGDPSGYDMAGRDCRWWIYTDRLSKEVFEAIYPNKKAVNFEDTEFDDAEDWEDEDFVRIAEYWYQEPVTKTMYLLPDGKTVDELPKGVVPLKEREVQSYEIYSCIYSGDAELTKPTKWAGKYFPWIRIYGEYVVIEGKVHWFGLTRHSKDAQRAHNLALTAATEVVATAPVNQNQFWATPKQAEGLSAHWADAVKRNLPAQLYNADPAAPGPPQRMQQAAVPVALFNFSAIMGEEIKADSGIFDASLGAASNETSGRAINARTQQAEIATFNFPANMASGIRRTWEVLVDLIPKIYDTTRSLRILGADDSEKYVKINHVDPQTGQAINDLSRGKYDVVITVGPSFSTKRQEAVDAYTGMAQGNPELMQAAGDLIMKGMDLPYADEISERLKLLLPPQIQQSINKDKPMPPEVQAAMAQANQAMQQVQQQGQLVQAAAQEAEATKAEAEKAKSDVQIQIANLKVQEAKLNEHYAQLQLAMAQKQMEIEQMLEQSKAETERSSLMDEAQKAGELIQEQAQQFIQAANDVMQALQQKEAELTQKVDREIAILMAPTSGGSPMPS